MNSKFFRLALCLGLLISAMNDSSFSMMGNTTLSDNKYQKLLDRINSENENIANLENVIQDIETELAKDPNNLQNPQNVNVLMNLFQKLFPIITTSRQLHLEISLIKHSKLGKYETIYNEHKELFDKNKQYIRKLFTTCSNLKRAISKQQKIIDKFMMEYNKVLEQAKTTSIYPDKDIRNRALEYDGTSSICED